MTLHVHGKEEKPIDTLEFLTALFDNTEQPIFFQTLANDASDASEANNKKSLQTRDVDPIVKFIGTHDRNRRGLFFCVATLAKGSPTRSKENTRETVGLHADLDFKAILEDEPTIRARILTLRCQPTVIVRSGGGLHLYWLFRESLNTQEYMELLEGALRRLADIVAGDPAVCEVSRLMRLPGTHNSKRGDMREVVCERLDGPRYELDELEEWMTEQQPVLTCKEISRTNRTAEEQTDDNPFTAFAKQTGERFGYKPPLDVDAMLASMTDGNVHDTQIRVAASMIKTGYPPEKVEQVLMEGTRLAMGDKKWDWRVERDVYVKKAISTAIRKYAPQEPVISREIAIDARSDDGNVVDFGDAKTQRKPRQAAKDGDKVDHIDIGTLFLENLKAAGQALMFTERGSYVYEDRVWRLQDDKSLKAWLDSRLETCVRLTKAKSNNKLIGEARAWVIRHPELQKSDVQFDRHGLVPTLSGLVDPRTLAIQQPSPSHYCTWRAPIDYDPEAKCPLWLEILSDTFADRSPEVRASYVALLQEWAGVGLLDKKAKALSRALSLIGGSNSGKSTLIEVIARLYGRSNNTTKIEALDKDHGTMPFAYREPWILHEAFEASKWHVSSMVKAIIEGKGIQINIKNGRIFDHEYTGPVLWGANSLPQFKEATKAITNRLLVIECRCEFDENVPVGVGIATHAQGLEEPFELIWRDEMPGVLVWALEGLKRALERRCFLIPDESRAALEDIRRDSNLVLGFVEDFVDFDPDTMVATSDFCAAFSVWWLEWKGETRSIPSNDSIGRAMVALGDRRVAIHRKELNVGGRRYYAGIRLSPDGVKYWDRAIVSSNFEGKTASTTSKDGQINTAIPAAWDAKPAVRAMREAQARKPNTSLSSTANTSRQKSEVSARSATSAPEVLGQVDDDQAVDGTDEIPF